MNPVGAFLVVSVCVVFVLFVVDALSLTTVGVVVVFVEFNPEARHEWRRTRAPTICLKPVIRTDALCASKCVDLEETTAKGAMYSHIYLGAN
jgi:hypothetical protein